MGPSAQVRLFFFFSSSLLGPPGRPETSPFERRREWALQGVDVRVVSGRQGQLLELPLQVGLPPGHHDPLLDHLHRELLRPERVRFERLVVVELLHERPEPATPPPAGVRPQGPRRRAVLATPTARAELRLRPGDGPERETAARGPPAPLRGLRPVGRRRGRLRRTGQCPGSWAVTSAGPAPVCSRPGLLPSRTAAEPLLGRAPPRAGRGDFGPARVDLKERARRGGFGPARVDLKERARRGGPPAPRLPPGLRATTRRPLGRTSEIPGASK